jgi:hypothetical protein
MHPAKWDHTARFDNKTVGVIGTGSSSVQIVLQLQKICKEVQVFILHPAWISPPFGSGKYVLPRGDIILWPKGTGVLARELTKGIRIVLIAFVSGRLTLPRC